MASVTLQVKSVSGGISSSQYMYGEGQYNTAIACDPDFPIGTGIKTSAAIVPTVYEEFSGAQISGYPKFLSTNPKNTNLYALASDGKFVRYNSSLASETLIGTPTSGAGNGMAYYNNYYYIATPTQVFRYGPLNNSPALSNALIANSELLDGWNGGSDTLLTNTTYPTVRGTTLPNHVMHVHGDDSLYLADFINGRGLIHRIHTMKTTDEGDTNDTTVPSAYNVLDLPFGYYPTAIASFDTDLVISAIRTTDSTVNQGSGALFFWDTIASSFYRQVPIPDPLVTAMKYLNWDLYIWSGNAVNGVRLSVYAGGQTVSQVAFLEEGTPPMAGAVDALGSKIVFGGVDHLSRFHGVCVCVRF